MRHVTLIAMLTSLVACGPKKFDSVNRTAQTVQSVVDAGPTFTRYNEAVLAFNTELTKSSESAADEQEAALLNLYGEALMPYTHALTLWILKEERKSDLLSRSPVLEQMLGPYEVTFDNDMIAVDATMKTIWAVAKTHLATANARFNER